MGRTDRRSQFNAETRIQLLEEDLDRAEREREEFNAEIRKLRGILVGVLVSITTASLLLVINIAVGSIGA